MFRSSVPGIARRPAALTALVAAALLIPSVTAAQAHRHGMDTIIATPSVAPGIPRSLGEEHVALHARLVAATKAPGKVGEAARAVGAVLYPHFVREEQIALPPLGLLRALAEGRAPQDAAAVLPMTDSLRAELPAMLTEHMAIGVALQRLERAAKDAGRPEIERLAADIRLHALTEEEVLYPAAVLVGDLVRARVTRSVRAGP